MITSLFPFEQYLGVGVVVKMALVQLSTRPVTLGSVNLVETPAVILRMHHQWIT